MTSLGVQSPEVPLKESVISPQGTSKGSKQQSSGKRKASGTTGVEVGRGLVAGGAHSAVRRK